ncbi:MAG: hypothetical protein RJB66_2450 [Pseudomonadota bacterium]|jgi:hypothetical protein
MTDEIIRKSALFFLLLTLDEEFSKEATRQALIELSNRLKEQAGASALEDSDLELAIRCCIEQWKLTRSQVYSNQSQLISIKALQWPEHIDLNPWKEFQKKCSENELLAVICVHILGLSEGALARCLRVSEGTIRYRVGSALALLGQLNRPSIGNIQYS